MKKSEFTWKVLFCSLLFSPCSQAQENRWIEFFTHSLEGKEVVIPSAETLKPTEVEKTRSAMWEAWKEANRLYDEEKLIALDNLGETSRSAWHLPENLEPHATMNYYYGYKGEKPAEGYPLFLYLHGSGPKAQEWSTGLKLAQVFADSPSVYFIPQIPNERNYYRWYLRSKQYAWEKLFRQAMLNPDIDPYKLYIFGISEGGYGSQRLASFYADYLAAAGPMAGGEPLKNAPVENCRHMAFSLRTGAQDHGFYRSILTNYTLHAFDSLQTVYPGNYRYKVELIPGYAHSIDYRPTTPWMRQFVRNPWPKEVTWEDYEMDGAHRRGFYNLVVEERPDSVLRTRYDLDIKGNHIDLQVRNVHYKTTQIDPKFGIEMKFEKTYSPAEKGKVIIYLNEHLVDLKKKVTVIVNGREVFSGKVVCSEAHMANSLATFYDPLRIYPAAIEVEIQ